MDLCEEAVSARKRRAMDLRNSPEDLSQRMLNALEPGTVRPIHMQRILKILTSIVKTMNAKVHPGS